MPSFIVNCKANRFDGTYTNTGYKNPSAIIYKIPTALPGDADVATAAAL